jgi:hypothetical protein
VHSINEANLLDLWTQDTLENQPIIGRAIPDLSALQPGSRWLRSALSWAL